MPKLLHQQRRMGIPEVLDEVIHPHGNRRGLSIGTGSGADFAEMMPGADGLEPGDVLVIGPDWKASPKL